MDKNTQCILICIIVVCIIVYCMKSREKYQSSTSLIATKCGCIKSNDNELCPASHKYCLTPGGPGGGGNSIGLMGNGTAQGLTCTDTKYGIIGYCCPSNCMQTEKELHLA